MDRQGLQLDPNDLKAPAPTRDDVRNPQPPRKRFSDWRQRFGRPRRWVLGGIFLLWVVGAAVDDASDRDTAASPTRPPVVNLPDDPAVSGYVARVEAVCRGRDRLIARKPIRSPLNEIARFEVETTSLIAAVPSPREAVEIRRTFLEARRSVDRLTLRAWREVKYDPMGQRTFNLRFRPAIIETVRDMYDTFAGLGAECNVAG